MNKKLTQVKIIDDKQVWESFLLSQNHPPFLQSWNAAIQEQQLGHESLKIGLYNGNALIGICLVHLIHAKRGKYLYIPYGPVLTDYSFEYLSELVNYLKEWGREQHYDFIRMAPYLKRTDETIRLFKQLKFRIAPIHVLSEIVWQLDLTPSEDELLMAMRKTTRNLIRRAEKDGVIIRKTQATTDIDTFIKLMEETHIRHGFVPYSNRLYHEQVNAFKDDNEVVVYTGIHEEQIIASAIIMYYGNVASYHHGASLRSKVPVAYLLQWEAIKEAKARGCTRYSFWGIDDTDNPKRPFYGITKFKKGFGGEIEYLLPAQDYPLSTKYWLNWTIETIRRIKRGFGIKRH